VAEKLSKESGLLAQVGDGAVGRRGETKNDEERRRAKRRKEIKNKKKKLLTLNFYFPGILHVIYMYGTSRLDSPLCQKPDQSLASPYVWLDTGDAC